jgi:FkbM family methyltransferase
MASDARRVLLPTASLLAVFVGAFGPWAQRFGTPVDGSDDELVGLVALVAVVALVLLTVTRSRRLAAVPLLAGLISAALIGHDLHDPAGPFGGPGPNIHLEWGIWTALAGSIGLAVGSLVLLGETARAAVGNGSLTRVPSARGIRSATRARTRLLGAFSDDAVLGELARRLGRPNEGGAQILAQLVGQMHLKDAGALVEQLAPVSELDYAPHHIELFVSSPEIRKRLGSVEKEPFTVDWIEQSIRPGDVFYDIGANVGPYSLIAAKATGNGARIFAFEPAPSSFQDLSRNILLNGCEESVVPVPLALWSRNGLISMTFRSLSAGAAKHRLDSNLRPGKPLTEAVVGIRLDDLVERLDLPVPNHAKIDVDGYELEVLQGAERTLARAEWRSIIIELDQEETDRNQAIKTLLANAGFDSGHRHEHPQTRRRPVVYWTFRRR